MSIVHEISITNRVITITKNNTIVQNGIDVDYLKITFDAEWDGISSYEVTFKNNNVGIKTVATKNSTIVIPWEALRQKGELEVTVVGYVGSVARIVTQKMSEPFIVKLSGHICQDPTEPTPNEMTQFYNKLNDVMDELKDLEMSISSPYNFLGALRSDELPTSGNAVNDTYYLTDLGYKVTWNGLAWFQSEDRNVTMHNLIEFIASDISDTLDFSVTHNPSLTMEGVHVGNLLQFMLRGKKDTKISKLGYTGYNICNSLVQGAHVDTTSWTGERKYAVLYRQYLEDGNTKDELIVEILSDFLSRKYAGSEKYSDYEDYIIIGIVKVKSVQKTRTYEYVWSVNDLEVSSGSSTSSLPHDMLPIKNDGLSLEILYENDEITCTLSGTGELLRPDGYRFEKSSSDNMADTFVREDSSVDDEDDTIYAIVVYTNNSVDTIAIVPISELSAYYSKNGIALSIVNIPGNPDSSSDSISISVYWSINDLSSSNVELDGSLTEFDKAADAGVVGYKINGLRSRGISGYMPIKKTDTFVLETTTNESTGDVTFTLNNSGNFLTTYIVRADGERFRWFNSTLYKTFDVSEYNDINAVYIVALATDYTSRLDIMTRDDFIQWYDTLNNYVIIATFTHDPTDGSINVYWTINDLGSGGSSIELATGLNESGKAADAKVVGDNLYTITERLADLESRIGQNGWSIDAYNLLSGEINVVTEDPILNLENS